MLTWFLAGLRLRGAGDLESCGISYAYICIMCMYRIGMYRVCFDTCIIETKNVMPGFTPFGSEKIQEFRRSILKQKESVGTVTPRYLMNA